MSVKTATVIGATGLIGGELLKLLLDDDHFKTVRVIIRRPFNREHPKLEKKLVDFNDNDSLLVALDGSDVIFCAVGTTQKKVKGDEEAYRKIDFMIGKVKSKVKYSTVEIIMKQGLHPYLNGIKEDLYEVANAFNQYYFAYS